MEKELLEHALLGEGEEGPTRLIGDDEGEEEGEEEAELTKIFRKKVEQVKNNYL